MKEEMARGSILREREVERQEYFHPLRKNKQSVCNRNGKGVKASVFHSVSEAKVRLCKAFPS